MGKDHEFQVRYVSRSCCATAARAAILTPFFGKSWFGREDQMIRATERLRRRWRARVRALRQAGFPPWHGDDLETRSRYTFARNCPPCVVAMTRRSRACNRPVICPFCYGRRVVFKAFRAIERVLFGAPGLKKNKRPHWNLVEFQTPHHYANDVTNWCPTMIRVEICQAVKHLLLRRRKELQAFEGDVGVVSHRFSLPGREFEMTRSGLVLTPRKSPALPLKPDTIHRVHSGPVSRSTLAWACGRAFRYSPTMLTAPPDEVIAILQGMHRARLFSAYGLRQFTKQKENGNRSPLLQIAVVLIGPLG